MTVFPAPLRAAAAGANRSVFAAAARRTGESPRQRPQSGLLDTCLHHLQLSPRQIEEKLRKELMDGLQRARGQSGNSTDVFSEWDLLQEQVGAQDSN